MADLRQILLETPGVTALTHADEQLFRAAFAKHALQYAHSWLYMLRAAHLEQGELGYKYVSSRMVAVIGYRHNFIYVTPLFDTTAGIELQKICDRLFLTTSKPVLIKKFMPRSFNQLTPAANIPPDELPLEDDTCPETILKLPRLFVTADGQVTPMAKKLVRRARAFEKTGISFDITEDIADVPFEKVKEFLAKDQEKFASYLPIVKYLYTQKTDPYKYRVMIFTHKGRVRGLYMTEILSLTDVGLYGGITSKDAGGITEWMDIYFFRTLYRAGIQTLHLGGTENIGIAEYIKKLFPHKPEYVSQTILHSHSLEIAPFTIRPATESDFNELAYLYRDFYNGLEDLGETWTKASAHAFVSHFYYRQPDLFFVAERNDTIIGAIVAAIQPWWDGNHLVEGEVMVHPRYKNPVLERRLLKHLLTAARNKYHTVAWDTLTPSSSDHPLGSYKKLGFNEVPQWAAITGDVHTVLERLGN